MLHPVSKPELAVPTTDSAANAYMMDALGSKADTAQGASAADKSALAYLKGIVTDTAEIGAAGAGLTALSTQTSVDAIQTDVGNPSIRTNLQSLTAMLGNPDTAGKTVYEAVKNVRETAIDGSSTPTANTLSDILHKDGSYTYDNTTDSLEALADALAIATATQPRIVSRNAANLPQTTQTAYFTVTGRVLITQIVGEVTTVIQTQACDLDLWSNPTVGADVALCAVNNITADAEGTVYTITGTLADALVATTSGAVKSQANAVLVTAGTIDLKAAASNSGATKWTLHYIPLDSGSSVTTA